MQSMLIIGAGRFGSSLAETLISQGVEVLIVDIREDKIDKISSVVTRAKIGDCMDIDVLEELSVSSFDICYVCTSNNFQASVEITFLLKQLGAQYVVSIADRALHAKLLEQVGADAVIFPERDMAKRTAIHYSNNGIFDYIELSPDYVITEVEPPKEWIGKSLKELDLRAKYKINVIGICCGQDMSAMVDPEYIFNSGEKVYIAGNHEGVQSIFSAKS